MQKTLIIRASAIAEWLEPGCDVTLQGDILFPTETWYCLGKCNGMVTYLIGGVNAIKECASHRNTFHA